MFYPGLFFTLFPQEPVGSALVSGVVGFALVLEGVGLASSAAASFGVSQIAHSYSRLLML